MQSTHDFKVSGWTRTERDHSIERYHFKFWDKNCYKVMMNSSCTYT